MIPPTRVRAVSLGHALDADGVRRGFVHSVFRRAVNLALGAELWTVLAEDRADLPMGIRVPLPGFDGLGLRRGDPVRVRAGYLGIGAHVVLDCRTARRWAPAGIAERRPGLERRLAALGAAARGRSWEESAAMAQALNAAVHEASRLPTALAAVLGRGPGATPSGDDVLVGVLAVLKSPHAGPAGARAADLLTRLLLPQLSRTTEVSGHLLRQAANGWFGRDLAELVGGLIGAASAAEWGAQIRRAIDTGATSGADTCEGVLAFAATFLGRREGRADE